MVDAGGLKAVARRLGRSLRHSEGAPMPAKLNKKIKVMAQEMNFLSQAYGVNRAGYPNNDTFKVDVVERTGKMSSSKSITPEAFEHFSARIWFARANVAAVRTTFLH